MIDNQLISDTANSIKHSLLNKQQKHESLFLLTKILPKSTSEKLKLYILNQSNSVWIDTADDFYTRNRQKIDWHSDTVIEELHCAFEQATDAVNQTFPKAQQHNFIGISLWKDSEGYSMPWHTDNPILSSAIQIYLFDCPDEYGTVFQIDHSKLTIPFEHNTGYLVDHSIEPKLLHRPAKTLPAGISRYSLYASWSFSEKLE